MSNENSKDWTAVYLPDRGGWRVATVICGRQSLHPVPPFKDEAAAQACADRLNRREAEQG